MQIANIKIKFSKFFGFGSHHREEEMASQKRNKPMLKEVPDIVINPNSKRTYTKGKFLGKGGFARCYELIENQTKRIYAGKVVSKTLLVKKHQRDKANNNQRHLKQPLII